MATLELENTHRATTDRWGTDTSVSDQDNPVTRRATPDALLSELETRAIERNREFHATILKRLSAAAPVLVNADEVVAD